jgi:tetratricopeptide (TPR) repeat protein
MYCNECGVRVEDNAVICPNCGHTLYRPTPPEESRPPQDEESSPQQEEGPPVPEEGTGLLQHEGLPIQRDEGPPVQHEVEPEALQAEAVSEPPEEELETPTPATEQRRGCGWAMIAGMLAGGALLVIVVLALLAIYQGTQERARLNRAAASDHYQKGLQQLAAGNHELAQAEFELVLQLDPRNTDATTKLAEIDALLGSEATPTSAVSQQQALLLYNEARQLYNQADWQGVITKLEQVRILDPDYERETVTGLLVEAYGKGGVQFVEQDRLEEAIRYFDRALELRPAEVAIREKKRLASLYMAGLGYWGANWQGAIDSFSVLFQLKPDYKDTEQRLYDAYVAYADTLYDDADWCAARDRYDSALAMQFSEELKAKREEAAQNCAVAAVPTGTLAPSGSFVGKVLRVEDVGLETAMMIRGHVFDGQGKPMTGVRVGLSAFDWSAVPAVTNAEGVFAFDGLGNPLTYTLTLLDVPAVPLPVQTDWKKLVWVEFRPQP